MSSFIKNIASFADSKSVLNFNSLWVKLFNAFCLSVISVKNIAIEFVDNFIAENS